MLIQSVRRSRTSPILRSSLSLRFLVFFALLSFLSKTQAFFLDFERDRKKALKPIPTKPFSPNLSYSILLSHPSNNEIVCDNVPNHVAFICDGNSRWAREHHLPTSFGHMAGADRFVELLEYLKTEGIQYCTFYLFSTENWHRPKGEIEAIFQLMEQTARKMTSRVLQEAHTIDIKILGDLEDDRIPLPLKSSLEDLQQITCSAKKEMRDGIPQRSLTVCLAINYGGRQDILQASQKLAKAVKAGVILSPDDITEETLESYMCTAGLPDPDMIIRTSGEFRLSNFLLWNCAYSEIYVTPVLWPDFDQKCWQNALKWYQKRQRRFGSRVTEEARPLNFTGYTSKVEII